METSGQLYGVWFLYRVTGPGFRIMFLNSLVHLVYSILYTDLLTTYWLKKVNNTISVSNITCRGTKLEIVTSTCTAISVKENCPYTDPQFNVELNIVTAILIILTSIY